MALNFPSSPSLDQVYTDGTRSWRWNGRFWQATSVTTGYTGSSGYAGSAGYTGSQGIQGDPGTSVTIVGSVPTSNDLPNPYVGNIGDGYITSDTGNLWVWDGNQWNDVGRIVGFTGSRGDIGFTGSQGDIGYTGSQGETGFVGSRGSTGYTGSQGEQGNIGFTGSQGYTGSLGDIGYTGSEGPQGQRGYTGSAGDLGYTGSEGVGFTGSAGYTGSASTEPGYTGSQGDPGTSVTIVGSVPTAANLPDPYSGQEGDGYITQDDGHLHVWDGSQWNDVGQLVGYTGSIGYTGSQGAGFTGSRGDTGFTGSTGFVGSRGALETWTTITSNTQAVNNSRYIADTSTGQFTVTLPSTPTVGYYVVITDGADWSSIPLVVEGDLTDTIEDYSDPVELDVAGITVEFIWDGGTWQVTATLGVQGDIGFTGSAGAPGEAAAIGYTGSQANLGAIAESIIPAENSLYDLGASNKQWRSLYVSSNTIYLGVNSLSVVTDVETSSTKLVLTAENGQPIEVGNASVQVLSTPPLNPDDGSMWMNDETGTFSVYVGGAWLAVGGPAGPKGNTGYTGSQGPAGQLITWAAAQTSNFTAVANFNYIVDTTDNAVTVTLPSSPQYGDHVMISDGGGNATTNNITITSAGNIMGGAADFTLDLNWSSVQLVYYNATKGWIITGTS